jgi:nitrate/TMAO reductase-like tetraheme cytochrome c subunit
VLFVIGLIGLVGASVVTVDATDYVFSTMKFCSGTCHVMESTVFQEYQKSKHWSTPAGVRPECADCHVSERLTFAMRDHFLSSGELFVWLTTDFSKPEAFEKIRPEAANTARFHLLDSNSANCKKCHVMDAIQPSRVRGQNAHRDAVATGNSNCITCHYNLVHKEVALSKEFLEAAAKYLGTPEESGAAQKSDETSESDGEEVL